MKLKNLFYILIGILGLITFWLFTDRKKRAIKANRIIKRLRKDNFEIKTAYLNLFEKYLKSQSNVDVGLIAELEKLRNSWSKLDFEVHIEIEGLVNDLNNGNSTNAVRKLAKIVESKLKEKAIKHKDFKGKPMLHNLLSFAKGKGWINSKQYENGLELKKVRNKESHEMDVKEDSISIGQSIYSGIDILYTI